MRCTIGCANHEEGLHLRASPLLDKHDDKSPSQRRQRYCIPLFLFENFNGQRTVLEDLVGDLYVNTALHSAFWSEHLGEERAPTGGYLADSLCSAAQCRFFVSMLMSIYLYKRVEEIYEIRREDRPGNPTGHYPDRHNIVSLD